MIAIETSTKKQSIAAGVREAIQNIVECDYPSLEDPISLRDLVEHRDVVKASGGMKKELLYGVVHTQVMTLMKTRKGWHLTKSPPRNQPNGRNGLSIYTKASEIAGEPEPIETPDVQQILSVYGNPAITPACNDEAPTVADRVLRPRKTMEELKTINEQRGADVAAKPKSLVVEFDGHKIKLSSDNGALNICVI